MRDRSESGLSVKAFCENAGFHENIYYYWQRKLRKAAHEEATGHQAKAKRLAPPVFAEVELAELPELPLPPPLDGWQSQISVEVPGVRITADSDYPIEKLAKLLKAMTQPC